MKKIIETVLGILIAVVVTAILFLSIFGFILGVTHWNGGICPECGTEYTTETYLHRGTSWISYHCENCEMYYTIAESWTKIK